MRLAIGALAFWALSSIASCSAPPPPETPDVAPRARGPERVFSYPSLDDRPVSSEALHGRASIVAFVATNGDASVIRSSTSRGYRSDYKPQVNVVAVFMDPTKNPDNTPLVRMYRDFQKMTFPVAMADAETVPGNGPFGAVGVTDGGRARRSGRRNLAKNRCERRHRAHARASRRPAPLTLCDRVSLRSLGGQATCPCNTRSALLGADERAKGGASDLFTFSSSCLSVLADIPGPCRSATVSGHPR